jgi:hypothetical protein
MMISGVISDTMGMLPAMKMTEPYSPMRAREGHGKAGQQRGRDGGEDDAGRRSASACRAQAGGGLFQFFLGVFQHRLHRAHHEGQADEDQRDHHPVAGLKASWMPSGSRY